MNETIKLIQDHRSIRSFLDKDVDDAVIDEILRSAQAMPNSINGQQTSVIVIKDKDTKKKIAEYTGNQTWIENAPVFLLFLIELLKLPEYTYPVVGLALGYPKDHSHKKPRLPFDPFKHEEVYHTSGLLESMEQYDKDMEDYLKEIGREQEGNWSKFTSGIYQSIYYPEVYPTMKKQKFLNDK